MSEFDLKDLQLHIAKIEDDLKAVNQQLTVLANSFDTVDKILDELKTSITRETEAETDRRLQIEIAEEVLSQRFSHAEELLIKLTDYEKIPKIVHHIYAYSQGNEEIVLNFANALTRWDITCYIFCALWHAMRANLTDPMKIIALAKVFQDVISDQNCASDGKEKLQAVLIDMLAEIESAATDIFTLAMNSGNYEKNVQVETISDAIYNFQDGLFDKVIVRVVDKVDSTLSSVKIADNVNSHNYISQVIPGLEALFNKLELNNALNDQAILNIGAHFKRFKKLETYDNLREENKRAVEKVITKMPICARNFIFAPSVIFWNKGVKEYLYAANFCPNYDTKRRAVFTWVPRDKINNSSWYAEKNGNYFQFKNRDRKGEYLYAHKDLYDETSRYVHSCIKTKESDDLTRDWLIELDGEYCYVKNRAYNEYLFASDSVQDDSNPVRRYVFTWKLCTIIAHRPEFQWKIIAD